MNGFYLTFGSNSQFPHRNTYLIVIANSKKEFRKKYPDVHENIINCSFIYSEKEWKENNMDRYYLKGEAEVIL